MKNRRMEKKTILKYLLAVLACTGFAAAARAALQDAVPGEDRQTTIRVYPRESAGKIKPVNGGNLAPPLEDEEMPGCNLREAFAGMHIPITRLHDAPLENPGMRLVDLPLIFANPEADAEDPDNYYFAQTDDYIANCIACGTEVYYRLGTSIEHSVNKYFVHPPEDVRKWVDVASNVIRHYTEGKWNGFRYDIRYWEIWNEPDLGPKMWTGTLQQFNDFYAQAATELKKRFPHLKFGGPGHCAFGEQAVRDFAGNCARHKAPLDFYSFHYYSPTDTELLQMAVDARRYLDECGYPETEIHLNEWHYNPYGGALWNMGPAEQNEAIRFMRGLESAAFLNTVMIGWQDTPLDKGFYYTVTTTRWGVFENRTPVKTYYGMKAFGELTAYPERVRTETDGMPAGSRVLEIGPPRVHAGHRWHREIRPNRSIPARRNAQPEPGIRNRADGRSVEDRDGFRLGRDPDPAFEKRLTCTEPKRPPRRSRPGSTSPATGTLKNSSYSAKHVPATAPAGPVRRTDSMRTNTCPDTARR